MPGLVWQVYILFSSVLTLPFRILTLLDEPKNKFTSLVLDFQVLGEGLIPEVTLGVKLESRETLMLYDGS